MLAIVVNGMEKSEVVGKMAAILKTCPLKRTSFPKKKIIIIL